MKECQRLMQMFYQGISKSAGCVYSSAIPFMPLCELRRRYKHCSTDAFTVRSSQSQGWPSEVWARNMRDNCYTLAWSRDGKLLCVGLRSSDIVLLSASTGDPQITLTNHTAAVNSVAFSFDNQHIASGSDDCTIRIWSVFGEEEQVFNGHTESVTSVAFSPDGCYIVSGSLDTSLRIWSVSGEQEVILKGHTEGVTSIAFSPDGKYIASGSSDHTVRIWSVPGGQGWVLRDRYGNHPHTQEVTSVAFSPDGQCVASASSDNIAHLWFPGPSWSSPDDTNTEKITNDCDSTVRWITFSPDGKHVVLVCRDSTVQIRSLSGAKQGRIIKVHHDAIQSVAFFPDHQSIVFTPIIHSIVQVSSLSDKHVEVINRHTRYVKSVVFSNDGQHIASASADNTARVWSASGEHKGVLPCSWALEWPVAFSDDSRWVKVTPGPSHRPVIRSVSTWKKPNWWKNITFSDINHPRVRIPVTYNCTND